MFGLVEPPYRHRSERNLVEIKRFKGGLLYHRETGQREVKKRIYSSKATVSLMPVEPFNCPKMVTSNLMIELTRTLLIPPKGLKTIYLRFPVEIGVIITKEGVNRVIDVFTDNPPKYALYGDIKEGMVCRYYGSDVYVRPPTADPAEEGVGQVIVRNATPAWREVSMLVFQGTMMKIFQSKDLVTFSARAKLLEDGKAETKFESTSWKEGPGMSYKMLTPRTFSLLNTKFMMEGGY